MAIQKMKTPLAEDARLTANTVIDLIDNAQATRVIEDGAIPCAKLALACIDGFIDKIDPAVAGNLAIQTADGGLEDAGVVPTTLADGTDITFAEAPAGTFTPSLTDTGVGAGSISTYVSTLTQDAKGRLTAITAGQLTDNLDNTHTLADGLVINAVVTSLQGLHVQDESGNGLLIERVDGVVSYQCKIGHGNNFGQKFEGSRPQLVHNSADDLSGTSTVVLDVVAANGIEIPGRIFLIPPANTLQGLLVRGTAAYTANFIQLQNSADTIQFAIGPTGQIKTNQLVAATVLGSVTDKMEIFDTAGASLGFIPIYDTIT